MPLLVNYFRASKRHFLDASLLQENGRVPNAGQLHGLSAECGLKALLVGLGHPIDSSDGSLDRSQGMRQHIDRLQASISTFSAFASGASVGHYISMIPSVSKFSDWLVDQRYYSEAVIPNSLEGWSDAALEIQIMIEEAQIRGHI